MRQTYLAHGMGVGKTFEEISIAVEAVERGIASKMLLVVPSDKVAEISGVDMAALYPLANFIVVKIPILDPKDPQSVEAYGQALARIREFERGVVIISHPGLTRLRLSEAYYKAEFERKRDEIWKQPKPDNMDLRSGSNKYKHPDDIWRERKEKQIEELSKEYEADQKIRGN